MLIFKILTTREREELQRLGETSGAPVDVSDGFVHFSTAAQVQETAAKHFSGEDGLWLLAFASEALGPALKWEPSRRGDLFPHLYGPLPLEAVTQVDDLPLGDDGRHVFPPLGDAVR